ncbi:MAG: hypothetical protein OQL06_12915 [Gammaproteobacteria bacterium]|nr:hypothetical protein [Gammaproteobacteria bacterium]
MLLFTKASLYFVFVCPLVALAGNVGNEFRRYSWETEVDPYYSNLGLYINLTDQPVPDRGDTSEREIYQDLLLRSHKPRFILLEASIYPMPVLGAYIREQHENFYQDAELGQKQNLVGILTAGFEEPYALSLFLGNMVTYGVDQSVEGKNKGFMGYLLSYGDKHLLNNEVIDDNWIEFEWKIKGNIVRAQRKLDWSFRLGAKWHDHQSIADAIYFGIRRDQLNINRAWLSFLDNSGVDVYFEFDQDTLDLTQQRLLVHKNIPLEGSKKIFTLSSGLIRTTDKRYLAPLQENTDLQIVIIPSIKF